MTVRIARGLFRVAALLYAAAGVIVAPAKGARAPVPINTHSFPRYQSLTAFGSPPQAVYFVCFSPAFVFENLPRGPPGSARYLQEIELIRAYLIRKARKRGFVK